MGVIDKNWGETWEQKKYDYYVRIYDNPFIQQEPFFNQIKFLISDEEELLFGGQAGGAKTSALLMSALMYCDYTPKEQVTYDALILRRTLDDLEMPNAILDRAKQWLLPFEDKGLVQYKDLKKKFTFHNGATLTFRYLAHNNDLNKYQGAELQFIGFDELTQFPENQYLYLHSRLRKTEDNPIPLRMRGASNPGGVGHDWVKKRFINPDSPCSYVPSAYTDNPYLNHDEYSKQLDKLDELTRQQLKFGNWDIIMRSGLLMDLETFNQRKIAYTDFRDWQPVYTSIGIDLASTGDDRFSMACLCYFNNGKLVLTDLDSTTSSKPEGRLINFIKRNQEYFPRVVNFEREPASSSHYALNYWRQILTDLSAKLGFYITDTPASQTGNKYNRAYKYAYHLRNGTMFVNRDIPVIYEGNEAYDPVQELGNQLVYLHPDKKVMANYRSPDESDAVAYGFEKLLESIGGLKI